MVAQDEMKEGSRRWRQDRRGLLAKSRSKAGQADMDQVFTAVVKHAPGAASFAHASLGLSAPYWAIYQGGSVLVANKMSGDIVTEHCELYRIHRWWWYSR